MPAVKSDWINNLCSMLLTVFDPMFDKLIAIKGQYMPHMLDVNR